MKKFSLVLCLLIFVSIVYSSSSHATQSQPNIQNTMQYPMKVAAKYDNSIYMIKTENHNYLVKEGIRIPIPVQYYYSIKNSLIFLGEDAILYYCSKDTPSKINTLLENSQAVVCTDINGNFTYALDKKGQLYRITIDPLKIEVIKRNVINLYSAWKDWVVYQTSDKKWWKHDANNEIVEIEHKSSDISPFIPSPKISFSSSSESHEIIGPWCIKEVEHHDLIGRHGGENLYNDYTTVSWEYIDGIAGASEIYTTSSQGNNFYQILGAFENNLYVSLLINRQDETSLKIFQIKSTEKENDKTENYGQGVISYYKCIYTEQIKDSNKIPHFFWTSNGLYKLSADKKEFHQISPYESSSGDSLEYIHSFRESYIDHWDLSVVRENTLYKTDSALRTAKKIATYEGNGIWIYSKGMLNAVYLNSDSRLILLRNGKSSVVKNKITAMDWDKSFALNGWIYLYADGYFIRFQPDDPGKFQTINIQLQSPVFDTQSVAGFYQNSLVKYTWSDNKSNPILKLNNPSTSYSHLIATNDGYAYYNYSAKRIESVSRSGKSLKVISDKMDGAKLWYESGYVYYIDKDNSLYRVLPNGKNPLKIMNDCINIAFYQSKIFCIAKTGIFSISPLDLSNQYVLKRNFTDCASGIKNQSYIENIEASGNRIIIYLMESVPDPDSDFRFLYKEEVHSIARNYTSDVILPTSSYCRIIDSYYYYLNSDGKVCRVGLDGKSNKVLY